MRAHFRLQNSMALVGVAVILIAFALPSAVVAEPESEPCSESLGAAHGHLDFLKRSTDPATVAEAGFGFVTFGTADDAPVAGVFRNGFGPAMLVSIAAEGSCRLVDGYLQLIVSFRDVRSGGATRLIATTRDRVEGPGRYDAAVHTANGDPLADGEVVLLGGIIVPD